MDARDERGLEAAARRDQPDPGRDTLGMHSPDYLVVAQIQRPRGLSGEVKAAILTDFPDRFSRLTEVYVGDDHRRIGIEHSRLEPRHVILKFQGYDTRTQAEALRGELVQIPLADAMPLEEGQHYVHQIIGLAVWTVDGECLGRVEDILFTGANDVYVVKKGDQELLIPVIEDVVRHIDVQKGTIEVKLMEGLR